MEYYAERGALKLISGIEISLCENSTKNISGCFDRNKQFWLEAKITLNTDWRQNGAVRACDRENIGLQTLKSICGIYH